MRRPYSAAVLLIVIVLVLYAPTLSYGFVYEDLNDPTRFIVPPTWEAMADRWWHRGLTTWTFGLSGLISPMEPFGYHLVSVLLHALNTVLLFWLGVTVWPLWSAFVCALLFAVHPIQVEAVAYISARHDLTMTTCVLLALLAAEHERWFLMIVACVGAVLAKESGIVAGPLALMWALGRKPLPLWLFKVSSVGILAGAVWLFWWHGLSRFDLTYTATETAKLWHLVSLVIVPFGLSIDHDYSQWPALWPWIALVGTVGLGCAALVSTRRWSFAVLFTLVALAPRLLTPLVEGIHEHHLYLPMVGLTLALVGTFTKGSDGVSTSLSQA